MNRKIPDSISRNIKKYRLLNHMTQEQLAELLNLDTQYYAQLERGERNFTIEKIICLCSIFQIGIEDIIEISPAEKADNTKYLQELIPKLENLSHSQLVLVENFITEIVIFIK